jgi:hypothetical protein
MQSGETFLQPEFPGNREKIQREIHDSSIEIPTRFVGTDLIQRGLLEKGSRKITGNYFAVSGN